MLADNSQLPHSVQFDPDQLQNILHILIEKVLGKSKFTELLESPLKGNLSNRLVQLPFYVCIACGGDLILAYHITASWLFVMTAAKLFDDIEDGDVKDDCALATNFASSYLLLSQAALSASAEVNGQFSMPTHVLNRFQHALLFASEGQYRDLASQNNHNITFDPDEWLRIASQKSGELFAWAASGGAAFTHVPDSYIENFHDFGRHLGILLQIADDFCEAFIQRETSPIALGMRSLPICYTMFVADTPNLEKLKWALSQSINGDRSGIELARHIITEEGAPQFILSLARIEYREALRALEQTGLPEHLLAPIKILIEGVVPMLKNNPL